MLVRKILKPGQQPAPEQIAGIREAAKRPVVFDEDCPELTPELLARLRPVKPQNLTEQGSA